jgi:8-oxo-dGTP pyrophosphatase MutT (NUDIX family)
MSEIADPPVRVALGVLVRDGRVLVARKRGGRAFTLPGGKPEPGESALACLRREILEELDIRLDAGAATPLGRFEAAAANEPGRRVEAEVFLLKTAAEPRACAEIEALDWRPVADDAADLAPLIRQEILPRLRP